MRSKLRRSLALFAVVGALLALIHAPADAKNTLLHAKFQRALVAAPLDSTVWTLSTTSFDTLEYVLTDNLDPTSIATLDTNTTSALAAVSHVPVGSTALVIEVTGSLQSSDSVYVGMQLSQGSSGQTDGSTGNPAGNQSISYNWRWYNAILPTGVVVNSAGSQTFVFPIPCSIGGPNAWAWAKAQRFFIQGDTNASAKGFTTRAWLVTRDRP